MMSASSNRRLRVLHVTASTAGGVGLLLVHLARLLPRDRFEMTVAFGPGYPLDGVLAGTGARVVHLPLARGLDPARNLRGLLALRRLLRRERFDIVHTHTSVGGAEGRLAARLARVPVTIWSTHLYASLDHLPALRKRAYLAAERFMDRWTTHYIAVAEAMKREGVAKGIMPPEKVTVIYNGIDLAPFATRPDVPGARRTLGLPARGPVMGILARFEPQKGVDDFLRAASRIVTTRSDVIFLVVGDGPCRPALEALARDFGLATRIRFTGWRAEVADALSAMDVLCLTSRWEALPTVLLEAMAAGRPVVATDVGGVREIVADGITGRIVPAGNPAAVAGAVLAILADPEAARRMGAAARTRVEDRFNLKATVEGHAALYERLWRWAEGRAVPGLLAPRPHHSRLWQELP